ncbi:MAG: iron chelate uptake ABC transporter family permease subunit [Flavobacteriaceae bacterium]
MLDDFFLRALAAGIGVAIVAGPLGCFIVWRRMAYFGDTMAHAALLGIALGILTGIDLMAGVFAAAAAVALFLVLLERRAGLSADALLGILAHSTLSIGLVLVALMTWVRTDLMSYLFGDILAVSTTDIAVIWIGGAVILALLALIWRPLLAGTVNRDLAAAEGMRPDRARLAFMFLLAATIAIAMKIVGILLITSLLIIPAAAARRFSATPEAMALFAALAGAVSVVAGLFGSLEFDTPSGPSIVVAALAVFLLTLAPLGAGREAGT